MKVYVVLIKDPQMKPYQYPMGKVTKIFKNILGEITHAEIYKNGTNEVIQRHSSVLIPYLSINHNYISTDFNSAPECELKDSSGSEDLFNSPDNKTFNLSSKRPVRQSAIKATQKIKEILNSE